MSKLTLNFFGEIINLDKPESLSSLRNEISRLFCLSSEDAAELILNYTENGVQKVITNDEDYKTFLKTKIESIDLDISQTSKIYKESLNQIQEESLKDKEKLEELMKKKEELQKLKETKFEEEKKEIQNIKEKILELKKVKKDIQKAISEGKKKINQEKKEVEKKIVEMKKKLGLPIEEKKKVKKPKKKEEGFFFPFTNEKFKFPLKNIFKKGKMHHHKFENKINENSDNSNKKSSDSNNIFDFNWQTFNDIGKCILSKTQEFTKNLAEKYKNNFGKSEDKKEDEKEKKEEKKDEVEIHRGFVCDGCNMTPIVGKRYKCKECEDFDYCGKCYEKKRGEHKHEFELIEKSQEIPCYFNFELPFHKYFKNHLHHFMPRHGHGRRPRGFQFEKMFPKMNHCPTMGNLFEKEKVSDKIVHFGISCNKCGVFPIIGCRYKCTVCDDYDLCEDCEKKAGAEHNHPFYKIKEPKMDPRFFK